MTESNMLIYSRCLIHLSRGKVTMGHVAHDIFQPTKGVEVALAIGFMKECNFCHRLIYKAKIFDQIDARNLCSLFLKKNPVVKDFVNLKQAVTSVIDAQNNPEFYCLCGRA